MNGFLHVDLAQESLGGPLYGSHVTSATSQQEEAPVTSVVQPGKEVLEYLSHCISHSATLLVGPKLLEVEVEPLGGRLRVYGRPDLGLRDLGRELVGVVAL